MLVRADALADAASETRPGAVLLEFLPEQTARRDSGPDPSSVSGPDSGPVVLAIGADALARVGEAHDVIDLPGHVLTPGFVNAHTHLDLTHIGPQPHDPSEGFTGFVRIVMRGRLSEGPELEASVRLGIDRSLAGGVVAVGDIGGVAGGVPSLVPWRTLARGPLRGVSYLEFFSIGTAESPARARIEQLLAEAGPEPVDARVRLGLQPHAPYSVNRASFARAIGWAGRSSPPMPLSTHLAETMDERRFIGQGDGPKLEFLRIIGAFTPKAETRERADLGHGLHPVEHMAALLEDASGRGAPFLVAHVNDADNAAIETLARTGTSVAYCPRSSTYFGAPGVFGPHRYRDMLAAGVNVCLGTDSIINLETPDRISPLDDARLLVTRDGLSPQLALELLTTRGAKALGLPEQQFRFETGSTLAGLVAVPGEDLAGAMASDAPPRLLSIGNQSGLVGIGSP